MEKIDYSQYELPKGMHLKTNNVGTKFEVNLYVNDKLKYIGLFSNYDAAMFTHKNYHRFAQQFIERNGRAQEDRYWVVKGRTFGANDIEKAFNYGKSLRYKKSETELTGFEFTEIMVQNQLSVENLCERWNVTKSVIEGCKSAQVVPCLYSDAIRYVRNYIKKN
jgi:hypothetical protein